jgi:lysosomal alpha-mannosidase
MGFDAWFFARLDYKDKEKRMNEKSMEWVWMPNKDSLGKDVNILTHALYAHYSSPAGFNYDILANSDQQPWINDKKSDTFNADTEAEAFIKYFEEKCEHYVTDECFTLFGDDFWYMNAAQNYESMDHMISYMNENHADKFNLFYSTPSQYVDAIAAYDVEWPTKYDDMFPYADAPDSVWTGYFSSRPNDKEYIRRASKNFDASS